VLVASSRNVNDDVAVDIERLRSHACVGAQCAALHRSVEYGACTVW
jgi:hypothetical protein